MILNKSSSLLNNKPPPCAAQTVSYHQSQGGLMVSDW